jgi:hypothetical protein
MWDLGAKVWDRSPPPAEPEHEAPATTVVTSEDPEKNASPPRDSDAYESDHSSIDKDLQDGVARVEGITSVWSFQTLIVVYVL